MFKSFQKDWHKIFTHRPFTLNGKGEVDYDRYWQERRKNLTTVKLTSFQKQRADLIAPYLNRGDTVLDLGCGDGNMLTYLKEVRSIKPIGADISQQAIQSLSAKEIEVLSLDLNHLKETDDIPNVDFITGFELIEHLPEPESLIYKLQSKTKKGFIFSFPNTGYYVHRLRLLFGKFPLQWRTHPGEHVRFWTVSDAKWWVKNLGFELEAIIPYEGLPILNRLLPSVFSRGIIIIIHKK